MTAPATSAAALVAIAMALLIWPTGPAGLLRGQLTGHQLSVVGSGDTASGATIVGVMRRYAPAAGLPVATVLLAPGLWWCGVLGAVPLGWYLGRRAGRPTPAVLREHRRELAGRLDLVAACLRSGLPIGSALVAVGAAGSPPTGAPSAATASAATAQTVRAPVDVLDEVAAMLTVGADPATAWRPAADLPDLASVAAAACRSAAGGTALAAAFTEQAEQLRRQNADAAATAAGRAGVLMTAPLGACFLPAFLCLGLAPAVVGLLGALHLW